ncbi:hypothetical protein ABZU32_01745 [Sphaerisporangium sp. NPDC005288]|uniref:hypothetical protein n=1 Tax=Sphaerisporangium sp. NPDC005288 TaxID=3155114 RepID=UPI0033BAA5F2
MFAKIVTAAALSAALSAGTALATGAGAYAEQAPPGGPSDAVKEVPAAGTPVAERSGVRIGAGRTIPGQGWAPYGPNGLYLNVDTTSGHFVGTPTYTWSIGGLEDHWALTGVNAVYMPTALGFRIYVRWWDSHAITPADAAKKGWYVNWIGVETNE